MRRSTDGSSSPSSNGTDFDGKVVVLAGASSGINLAIAQRFATLGASTVVLSRDRDRIERAAQQISETGGQCMGLVADVRDPDDVKRAYERTSEVYGSIDVVVSGAAGNFLAPVLGLSPNAFRTVVDIDLNGTFNVLSLAWPFLTKPGASLISITAPQATRPTMLQAHACAAKAGVNMLTKVLAMEWGPAGVRVNAISPGFIENTEGTARLIDTPEKAEALRSSIPLRRLGDTGDIADLAVFLCRAESRFITGSVIDCDGGYILGSADADALSLDDSVGGVVSAH
ncbi:SDR family oxidoreductase [Rhodococcus jostii]|uniref:SDR family oxidoreductase n=1 Tax=Rhodococcus jostii TaxID=132919 RepID=UPI003659D7DD